MKQVISMHGWLGCTQEWHPWQKSFETNGWFWQNGDRGYWSEKEIIPTWICSKSGNTSNIKVAICHSMGIHLLPPRIIKEANLVILINGFGQFIPQSNLGKIIQNNISKLKSAIGTETEYEVLNSFFKKTIYNKSNKHENILDKKSITPNGRKKLLIDLNYLVKCTGLPKEFPKNARILTITSLLDEIVIPEVSKLLIKELKISTNSKTTHWALEEEGHYPKNPLLINKVIQWLKFYDEK